MKGNENIKHPIGIDPQEITGAAAPGTTVEGPAVDCRGFEEGLVLLSEAREPASGWNIRRTFGVLKYFTDF